MTDIYQRQGKIREDASNSTNLPLRSVVSNVNPDKDTVAVNLSLTSGNDTIPIRHPYAGVNSWIRAVPEIGAELYIQQRGDSVGNVIFGYDLADSPRRIQEGKDGATLFRLLNPGELELMSSGRAYIFLGDRGDIEMRGGTVRSDLLQTELEFTSSAPTYRRNLHMQANTSLAHEERFGVVKRPDQQNPNSMSKYVKLSDDTFAIEYGRWLNTKDGTLLSSEQEGNVYGYDGKVIKQSSTNKDLRYIRTFGHSDKSSTLTFEVDENLNIRYDNTATDAKESKFNFGSQNTLDISADAFKITMTKTGTMTFNTSLSVTSNTINLKSSSVNIGNAPSFPAILGSTLIQSITPLTAVLQTFFQTYGADPALSMVTPQTIAAANAVAAVLIQTQASLPNSLSKEVKLSG